MKRAHLKSSRFFKQGKEMRKSEGEGSKAGDKAGRFIREYQQVLSIHVTSGGEKERKAQYAFKFLYMRSQKGKGEKANIDKDDEI